MRRVLIGAHSLFGLTPSPRAAVAPVRGGPLNTFYSLNLYFVQRIRRMYYVSGLCTYANLVCI